MTVSADFELTQPPIVNAGMLIRRPREAVFAAFIDPAITTQFWFTRSSGGLGPGASVEWAWEMHGVSAEVAITEFEENSKLVFDWGPKGSPRKSWTTVQIRFIPGPDHSTYVQITESRFHGTGDEVVAKALDSTGGFTMVLCALKALLEHDVLLTVVADKAPPAGLDL
jgi:uncharacterized protein YndB with AHSA1/START domain